MSFLAELRARRTRLQPTQTTVRYADGRRELLLTSAGQCQPLAPAAQGFVVDRAPDALPACVFGDWLFLGAQDAVSERLHEDYGITHLLSVGIEAPVATPQLSALFVPCLDLPETQLLALLDTTDRFLEGCRRSGGRVLVHCNAGVSRSASVVLGYLMRAERMGYAEALALLRTKRPCCRPNDGFAAQLKKLAEGLNGA